MLITRKSNYINNLYRREYIGDIIFTDDPNDDWVCISFNIYIYILGIIVQILYI